MSLLLIQKWRINCKHQVLSPSSAATFNNHTERNLSQNRHRGQFIHPQYQEIDQNALQPQTKKLPLSCSCHAFIQSTYTWGVQQAHNPSLGAVMGNSGKSPSQITELKKECLTGRPACPAESRLVEWAVVSLLASYCSFIKHTEYLLLPPHVFVFTGDGLVVRWSK